MATKKKKKKHKPDPPEWLITRRPVSKNGKLAHITNNGNKGYIKKGKKSQVHHIVSITCMSDGMIEKKVKNPNMEFVHNCLAITDWDINKQPNTIGLPLTTAYYWDKTKSWDGLPCHQVDHDIYYEDVADHLYSTIWEPLIALKEACIIEEANIVFELEDASEFFESFLRIRGKGTRYYWENRNDPTLVDVWYFPFSMGISSQRKREPAPSLSKATAQKMRELFKAL